MDNIGANKNIRFRFANGSCIETLPRNLEIKVPYDIVSASADVNPETLDKLIDKINEAMGVKPETPSESDFWKSFMELQKRHRKKEEITTPSISFEQTMGFNT